MSFITRLLERNLASKNEEINIILAASPATSKKTLSSDERQKINDFLKLSDATDIDVRVRLAAYRSCNTVISSLPPTAPEYGQVHSKSIVAVCPPRGKFPPRASARTALPPLSSAPNAFHRVVVDTEISGRELPDGDEVFTQLFEGKDTLKHPAGLSTLTFAFANLIALSRAYPSYDDHNLNQTSGLFDLYPVYGSTDQEAKDTIRVIEPDEIGWGLLQTDAFFEVGERLEFLPPATAVLLILFSRNHNSIARRLFKENQQKRWVEPTTLKEESPERQSQDDEIFALAKRVNQAVFRKIVSTDFLKGLLGLSPVDDVPSINLVKDGLKADSHANSIEFSALYGWLGTLADHEVDIVKDALSQIDDPDSVTAEEVDEFYSAYAGVADLDRGTRPSAGLSREDGNKFNDGQLAGILQKATETVAHAFRPRGTAELLAPLEVNGLERSRRYKVCSLNEFRSALGLAPYKSFEEWSSVPDIVKAAKDLYSDIKYLELYTGLRGESGVDGKGLGLGETLTYALITDIVQVVRSDPATKADEKLAEVTQLGADLIKTKPDNGAFGATLPNIILDNLPNDYNYNSSFGLFPFVTPEKAKELLKERAEAAAAAGKSEAPGPNDIDFGKPKPSPTHTITDPNAAKDILNSDKFKNPLADDITKLTDGIGILLGLDRDSHAKDGFLTVSSFLSEKSSLKRYSSFLRRTIRDYIERYGKDAGGGRKEVNYQEVINGAAAAWAAEILVGITLDKENGLTTKDFFEKLKDINDTLFGTVAPQDKFSTLKRAKDAAQLIRKLIEHNLTSSIADPGEETFLESILHLLRELILGEPHIHTKRAHDFLAKLSVSSRDNKEVSANVLGFAVITSISFAKILQTSVSFYLDEARSKEKEDLIKSNLDRVLGYVREAERLSPTPSAPLVALEDTVIKLSNGQTIQIKKGDRIIIDPSAVQPEDKTINPERPIKGSFVPFIEGTVPEALLIILGLNALKVEKGSSLISYLPIIKKKQPKLKGVTLRKKRTPIISFIFDVIYVSLAIYFIYYVWIAAGNKLDHWNTRTCLNPTHIRPWEAYTMLPGPDNRTAPFIITLDSPKKRQFTFVDLDQRDMRFQVYVDGKKKALSSDFVLDRRVECGGDVEKCLAQGFSRASVIVSQGKKVIKLEWVGKDIVPGTNLIDWGGEASRRFAWKQEAC